MKKNILSLVATAALVVVGGTVFAGDEIPTLGQNSSRELGAQLNTADLNTAYAKSGKVDAKAAFTGEEVPTLSWNSSRELGARLYAADAAGDIAVKGAAAGGITAVKDARGTDDLSVLFHRALGPGGSDLP